jgi:hypothetical protein
MEGHCLLGAVDLMRVVQFLIGNPILNWQFMGRLGSQGNLVSGDSLERRPMNCQFKIGRQLPTMWPHVTCPLVTGSPRARDNTGELPSKRACCLYSCCPRLVTAWALGNGFLMVRRVIPAGMASSGSLLRTMAEYFIRMSKIIPGWECISREDLQQNQGPLLCQLSHSNRMFLN